MGRPKGSKNKKKEIQEPVQEAVDIESDEPMMPSQTNDVAMAEKNRALDLGLNDPDFDFRQLYAQREKIYYVYVNDLDGTKEVQELILRTIYARSMIAYEEGGMCRCIGYKEKDMVFTRKAEAEEVCNNIKVVAKYGEN